MEKFKIVQKIVCFIWTNVNFGGIFLDLGGKIANFMWTKFESQIVEFVYNYEVSNGYYPFKLSMFLIVFFYHIFWFYNARI